MKHIIKDIAMDCLICLIATLVYWAFMAFWVCNPKSYSCKGTWQLSEGTYESLFSDDQANGTWDRVIVGDNYLAIIPGTRTTYIGHSFSKDLQKHYVSSKVFSMSDPGTYVNKDGQQIASLSISAAFIPGAAYSIPGADSITFGSNRFRKDTYVLSLRCRIPNGTNHGYRFLKVSNSTKVPEYILEEEDQSDSNIIPSWIYGTWSITTADETETMEIKENGQVVDVMYGHLDYGTFTYSDGELIIKYANTGGMVVSLPVDLSSQRIGDGEGNYWHKTGSPANSIQNNRSDSAPQLSQLNQEYQRLLSELNNTADPAARQRIQTRMQVIKSQIEAAQRGVVNEMSY